MDEIFRMLGKEHQADLERDALKWRRAAEVRRSPAAPESERPPKFERLTAARAVTFLVRGVQIRLRRSSTRAAEKHPRSQLDLGRASSLQQDSPEPFESEGDRMTPQHKKLGKLVSPVAVATGNRVAAAAAGVAIVAMLAAGVAWAGTIIGTPKGEVLRGSPRNDKIYGKAGNDRLYGYGGNDLLVGGPGADLLACGAGRDVAIADKKDKVRKDCEVVKGLPEPLPQPPPSSDNSGLYISLGASAAAGEGASVPSKSWVNLYFGYLASNGSGVTRLENLAQAGATTTDVRNRQVPGAVSIIDGSSNTIRVTIGIGRNDFCVNANDPGCPVGDNLRAIFTTLNEALARDPGDETIQIMEFFNSDIGTDQESATRTYLLGSDLKVDCSGTDGALGLNDLIHCIALEKNALPVDLLPAFDAGGVSFLADDHFHPNDAGHLAIARAFGGAVERAP